MASTLGPSVRWGDSPRRDRVVLAYQQVSRARSAEAAHQRLRKHEAQFLADVAFLERQGALTRLARLRALFENAADPASRPDLSDDALRALCRALHPADQQDDTARLELLDGPLTVDEEVRMLRAVYVTLARLTQLARCLEGRKEARR